MVKLYSWYVGASLNVCILWYSDNVGTSGFSPSFGILGFSSNFGTLAFRFDSGNLGLSFHFGIWVFFFNVHILWLNFILRTMGHSFNICILWLNLNVGTLWLSWMLIFWGLAWIMCLVSMLAFQNSSGICHFVVYLEWWYFGYILNFLAFSEPSLNVWFFSVYHYCFVVGFTFNFVILGLSNNLGILEVSALILVFGGLAPMLLFGFDV